MMGDMGRHQQTAEDEIERDIADWVGPQDANAYRREMRGTLWYRMAGTADASARAGAHVEAAWEELVNALTRFIRRTRRPG